MPEPDAPAEPPHDRRAEPVTYVLDARLDDAAPPVWRRLAVSSALHLDEVHAVLQAAFGWEDYHLHRFSGDPEDPWGQPAYLSPFEVREGDAGLPDELVRLDEALAHEGQRLRYLYDYGDGWRVTLTLEAIEPRDPADPPATCRDGHGAEPPEDCGGVPGYELLRAAADPSHPEHEERRAEVRERVEVDGEPLPTTLVPFAVDTVSARLAQLVLGSPPRPRALPLPVADLLARMPSPPVRRTLLRLLGEAELDAVADDEVDADTAAAAVRPYQWLLERVGEDGIRLTKAGYLPPADVEATMQALDLWEDWIGKGNREDLTLPVLELRESAQRLGLLRKHRGRLLRTKRGAAAAADPVRLYRDLAERMPPARRDTAEHRAGTVLLLALAARGTAAEQLEALVAEALVAEGWRHTDGTPLDHSTILAVQRPTLALLQRIGALVRDRGRLTGRVPTDVARPFARLALASAPRAPVAPSTSDP